MKKTIVCFLLLLAACGQKEQDKNAEPANNSMEQSSGEQISPQLEMQGEDRLKVDTINNAGEAHEEKKHDDLNILDK